MQKWKVLKELTQFALGAKQPAEVIVQHKLPNIQLKKK